MDVGRSRESQVSFLQGLAESDGNIDPSGYTVRLWVYPSAEAISLMLTRMGVGARVYEEIPGRGYVAVRLSDAMSLPIFNEYIRSYKYELMRKISQARRLGKNRLSQLILRKIVSLRRKGCNRGEIRRKMLLDHSLLIRYDSLVAIWPKLRRIARSSGLEDD